MGTKKGSIRGSFPLEFTVWIFCAYGAMIFRNESRPRELGQRSRHPHAGRRLSSDLWRDAFASLRVLPDHELGRHDRSALGGQQSTRRGLDDLARTFLARRDHLQPDRPDLPSRRHLANHRHPRDHPFPRLIISDALSFSPLINRASNQKPRESRAFAILMVR